LVAGIMLRTLRAIPADHAQDMPIYRDQLAEVDRDIARGVLSQQEAARLRTEVSRRLLDASRAQAVDVTGGMNGGSAQGAAMIWGAVCAALVGAFGLYIWLGAPKYWDQPLRKRLAMADAAYASRPSQDAAARPDVQQAADETFLALIAQLRAAVAARPDDIQGLTLLARNEAALGNPAAAAAAYTQLIAVKGGKGSLDDHLGAAQAMIVSAQGIVSPQAEDHLIAALEMDPQNPLAQYFIGLMFAQTGRPDRTFALWEPLLRAGPQGAIWIEPIRGMLPQVAAAAGVKYQLPDAPTDGLPDDPTGPDAAAMADAADMTDAERQDMIQTMVAGLETRLMEQGGTLDEWLRLIRALGVMGGEDRRAAALAIALAAFENDPAAAEKLREAAQ
jgi:cytochrome c-type biogenesis protein CcmH